MAKTYAIVGCTGAVGQQMIKCLEQSQCQVADLKLLATKKSVGKEFSFRSKSYVVEECQESSFDGVDIALFSAGGSVSAKWIPIAQKKGVISIDNTSTFRLTSGVPLVVPEVNAKTIAQHQGVIANPNCSTIQLVVLLKPLADQFGLNRVEVSTYQSTSGAGGKALDELRVGSQQYLNQEEVTHQHFVKPMAFNCIPQIDVFQDNRYTKEEMKMILESKKILNQAHLRISATAVRVPIFYTHCESVTIDLVEKASLEQVIETLESAPGLVVSKAADQFPTPTEVAGKTETYVGRIRQDYHAANTFHFWICADNLLKGAAYNAVQIAESLEQD